MDSIIQYLNVNTGALTVIFTAIVTLSTVVYAVLTGVLVSETRKMREVQTEPKIQITMESFEFAIHISRLRIQNIGFGPATDLKFECAVVSGGESAEALLSDFIESNFFKTGLRYFGPNQTVHSHYTDTSVDSNGKLDSVLSFSLSYKSATGKAYKDEILIDMSELKSEYRLGKPYLYSISQSLEKIQKDINHVATGFKRVKVDSYNSEDRDHEREYQKKRLEELKQRRNDS
ncbi:hypothetical protein [Vibrio parahaemolyticus]|uniref:hypothetical protein n=1 Tax=Vibrio parahaemolyticus TaxID=670 RepID=UPI0011211038|nr:hypothetical protein [Vibrio parahaemolyticus]TOP41068.1 hypothetical protein CGH15_22565 [Vibrio parahaemolyticus]HCE1838692.1 hypothetical protein [Vibrio parahaemolyticus]HCE1934571.1 hypothetical protein [Vibrio parahaemolyticus]HCG6960968.1 hypothetical protein [Vibrio parahaemolyticus]HCG8326553.1 hypothetical protein [Vibrio parahaemolyticus]